mgnify:CR=1 FL=1
MCSRALNVFKILPQREFGRCVRGHDEGVIDDYRPGSFLLTAYAADSGKRVWWVGGLSFELKSVPIIHGDTLFLAAADAHLIAIDAKTGRRMQMSASFCINSRS